MLDPDPNPSVRICSPVFLLFCYFAIPLGSVIDRHRFDANPAPAFHFHAAPDPDHTLSFTRVEKMFL
jgi:hypothetical protein